MSTKQKAIFIGIFVLLILYYFYKKSVSQVSSSVAGQKNPSTTSNVQGTNFLTNLLNNIFKPSQPVSGYPATQPTLKQLGATITKGTFDYSYCGVSPKVIDPTNGVHVNWCIDANTGDTYSLDSFPNGNVPFKILTNPNQVLLSENMNGLSTDVYRQNAYNDANTASNTPTFSFPIINSDGSIST